jgi:ornithine carbamoyltransferase
MSVNMKGRDLKSIVDLTAEEMHEIFKTTESLKLKRYTGEPHRLLEGKTLAMIFQKPSTRTRVSFEVAIEELGGHAMYLGAKDMQLGRGETVLDTARVLCRYVHGIMARVFAHKDILDLAEGSSVPVINGLSDYSHPCQILADLFTIHEKKGSLAGLKLAYIGDGNNVCNSLLFGCAKMGMHMSFAGGKKYFPDPKVVSIAQGFAKSTGSKIELTEDPAKAVKNADVIYTDVWASMGQEEEHAKRVKELMPYQVNSKLVAKAKPDVIVMHCLPAHRNEEITDEVVDGPHSVVFDEAENRLHAQKAVLALVM